MLIEYHKRNNDWLMIRHEDICKKPDESFNNIFSWAGLNYSERIKTQVKLLTTVNNPIQARNNKLHDFARNASSLANYWQNEIVPNQADKIRQITDPISSLYYDNQSWEYSNNIL